MTADPDIRIVWLRREDRAAWLPPWHGYQSFRQVSTPPEVSATTWTGSSIPPSPLPGAAQHAQM